MELSIHILGFCFNILKLHLQGIELSNPPIQEWRTTAMASGLNLPEFLDGKNQKVLIQLGCALLQMSQVSLIQGVWQTLPEIPRFLVFANSALNSRSGEKTCSPKEFEVLGELFTQKHLSTTE